jgi:hypothetical protein
LNPRREEEEEEEEERKKEDRRKRRGIFIKGQRRNPTTMVPGIYSNSIEFTFVFLSDERRRKKEEEEQEEEELKERRKIKRKKKKIYCFHSWMMEYIEGDDTIVGLNSNC